MYRLRIDREKCIGSENCVASAPSVFQIDEDDKAVLLDPATVDDDTLLFAAELCPTEAIIIEDEYGRQVYP